MESPRNGCFAGSNAVTGNEAGQAKALALSATPPAEGDGV